MLKSKSSVIAKCDDCGASRKEIDRDRKGEEGILARLADEGWRIGQRPFEEPCYCPSCAEVRANPN